SISDGTTGLLANNPAAFERAWIDLTADTSRRLAFGQAAKERAMTTTWDTTAKAFAGFAAEAVELHTLRRKHTS
ncbi:MAG TPA: hypothetical protein VGS21_12090, partial [Acidimicrobiales bacterium]|nr:hypothetical protein [Acidimicrobiales bacterium]